MRHRKHHHLAPAGALAIFAMLTAPALSLGRDASEENSNAANHICHVSFTPTEDGWLASYKGMRNGKMAKTSKVKLPKDIDPLSIAAALQDGKDCIAVTITTKA